MLSLCGHGFSVLSKAEKTETSLAKRTYRNSPQPTIFTSFIGVAKRLLESLSDPHNNPFPPINSTLVTGDMDEQGCPPSITAILALALLPGRWTCS